METKEIFLSVGDLSLSFNYEELMPSVAVDLCFEDPSASKCSFDLDRILSLKSSFELARILLELFQVFFVKPFSMINLKNLSADQLHILYDDLDNIRGYFSFREVVSLAVLDQALKDKDYNLLALSCLIIYQTNPSYYYEISLILMKYYQQNDDTELLKLMLDLITTDGHYDLNLIMALKPAGFPFGPYQQLEIELYKVCQGGVFEKTGVEVPEPTELPVVDYLSKMESVYLEPDFKNKIQERLTEFFPKLNKILGSHSGNERVILAGGSVMLAATNLWSQYKNQTDLDFFLVGNSASGKRSVLNSLIKYFNSLCVNFYARGSVLEIRHSKLPKIQIIFSDAKTPFELLYSFDLSHIQIGLSRHGILFTPEWARYTPFSVSKLMIPFLRIPRLIKTLTRGFNIITDFNYLKLYYTIKAISATGKVFPVTRHIEIEANKYTLDNQANISTLGNFESYQNSKPPTSISAIDIIANNTIKQGAFSGGMLEYNSSAHSGAFYDVKKPAMDFIISKTLLVREATIIDTPAIIYSNQSSSIQKYKVLRCDIAILPSDDNYSMITKTDILLKPVDYYISLYNEVAKQLPSWVKTRILSGVYKALACKFELHCQITEETIFLDINNNIIDPYPVKPDENYSYDLIISGAPNAFVRVVFRRAKNPF